MPSNLARHKSQSGLSLMEATLALALTGLLAMLLAPALPFLSEFMARTQKPQPHLTLLAQQQRLQHLLHMAAQKGWQGDVHSLHVPLRAQIEGEAPHLRIELQSKNIRMLHCRDANCQKIAETMQLSKSVNNRLRYFNGSDWQDHWHDARTPPILIEIPSAPISLILPSFISPIPPS